MKLSDIVTEGSNLHCPNCGEDLGKDTQNPKSMSCGNCGEDDIKNERGYETDEDGYEI